MTDDRQELNMEDEAPEKEHHHASGHGSHHAKKSRWRILKHRIKKAVKTQPWLLPLAVLILACIVGGAIWIAGTIRSQNDSTISAQSQVNVGSGYRDVLYQGKKYRYNSRITTVLYAGVDSDGPLTVNGKYTFAPRADSVSLIVLDEYHHRMTVIALNRDTMTMIHRYTLNGKDRGLFKDHLGYAYTYGEGGTVSCKNLCTAVSELLYGIPINDYIVSNRSSMPLLAELLGPTRVTVPNDDLADAGYAAGDEITVDAENIEVFLRTRDIGKDLSNVGRMERQQAYITASVARMRELFRDDSNGVWHRIESAESVIQTNITRSRYLDLVNAVNNTGTGAADYYIPDGEQVVGESHDEFYPDQAALLSRIMEIFYIPR